MASLPTGLTAMLAIGLIVGPSIDGSPAAQTPIADSSQNAAEVTDGEVLLENEEVAPEVEAHEVGEALELLDADPVFPVLTVYEPRVLEAPLLSEGDVVDIATAVFPIPDGCAPSTAEASLACATGAVDLSSTVIDDNGDFLPVEISADPEQILLTSPISEDLAYPLIFTIYLAESGAPELLDAAEETLAWMIAEDEGPGLTAEELAAEEQQLNEEAEANGYTDNEEEADHTEIQSSLLHGTFSTVDAHFQAQSAASITAVPASSSRPRKVTIPSSYRYCPNSCTPPARHDYCTSPARNYWATLSGVADFRGPCARHDMMIANIAKKKISLSSKQTQRYQGDLQFRANLQQNCRHGFYKLNQTGGKASCFVTTGAYYSAVVYTTWRWNGK
ncbi:hypothetical protein [Nesterenkonia sphaerica]|uniref:Phospholipase n=1 Tax=Nesterenkonia sphaerica TaxID=1804988 RepID=A0A5R9AC67_9MICC|nr:hypothetical protein [Nesterenkonia sphaerica]TLP75724.1 hypothetical protein FEF27_06720 [Nesterenkonia sphaerica]